MFDAARPASTLAELVEADLLGLTRPSPRQIFAHASEPRAIAPERFLRLTAEATRLGLFPFVLNRIGAREVGGFEFYVSMRCDAEEDPAALRQLQDGAIDYLGRVLAQQRRIATLLAN